MGLLRCYLRGVNERKCSGGAPGFPKGLEGKAAHYVETVGVEEAFYFFYNGKEFSVCTVERAGREVSKGKISWWKKGRIPVSDDITREDSGPQRLWGLSRSGWEMENNWVKGQDGGGITPHLRAWILESDVSSGSAIASGILVTLDLGPII